MKDKINEDAYLLGPPEPVLKTTVQIKTGEFEYIMQEGEHTATGAVEAFRALKHAWEGGKGLAEKDYNIFIDRYLLGEENQLETYNAMNDTQKWCVQVIKRSLKRIKSRETK